LIFLVLFKKLQTTFPVMKCVLITLYIFPFLSLAQYPNKANMALLETDSLSGRLLLDVCLEVLESEGYHLDRSDYTTMTLQTQPVEILELPLFFKLEIHVQGTLASIQGYIRDGRNFAMKGFPAINKPWEDAAYRSFRGSTWRTGFEVVTKVVEKIRSRAYGKVRWVRLD
jgi:hypothetical protein